jgi:ABC-type sulfate transport system substrate-binding protein
MAFQKGSPDMNLLAGFPVAWPNSVVLGENDD